MGEQLPSEERRQFSRILFNAACHIHQDGMEWPTEVLDISMRGLLIRRPDYFPLDTQSPCEATIKLAGSDQCIIMSLKFSHENEGALGFQCESIDIDSMTHLKRLVELNLGSNRMLKRELNLLSDA